MLLPQYNKLIVPLINIFNEQNPREIVEEMEQYIKFKQLANQLLLSKHFTNEFIKLFILQFLIRGTIIKPFI